MLYFFLFHEESIYEFSELYEIWHASKSVTDACTTPKEYAPSTSLKTAVHMKKHWACWVQWTLIRLGECPGLIRVFAGHTGVCWFCCAQAQMLLWISKWASSQQNDCAQRRLRSAWACAQSDQSLLCAQWVAKDPSFLHADSKDSDQTGRMPRLIWIFARHTCHFVGFITRRLKFVILRTCTGNVSKVSEMQMDHK